MTTNKTERTMTDAEIRQLTPRSHGFPRSFDELKEFAGTVASLTFGFSAILIVAWLLLAWVLGFFVDAPLGWDSGYRNYIVGTVVALCFIYTVYEVQRSEKPTAERAKALQADVDQRKVLIEEHTFTAVKVAEEPEHGGLIYFFLNTEGRVYVLLDYESVYTGIEEEDPPQSTFVPKSRLRIEVTPVARVPLAEDFDGEILEVPEPFLMTSKTRVWPEPETFIDTPWDRIESTYGA
ncbi:MAG: hypothetical protein QNJ00_12430 [Woeseiaceae bacterium]|nr:hypothetical protein [Woeseiaceae bacterium]